jgi:hypothetical protein
MERVKASASASTSQRDAPDRSKVSLRDAPAAGASQKRVGTAVPQRFGHGNLLERIGASPARSEISRAPPRDVSAPTATRPNRTGLPDRLKTGVERLSGFSLDDVRVHYNSPKPAQLHALAYAQATEIHIGPGQARHLPHEAWHVVQQKQGRVKPTLQAKGVAINDDAGLEREADVMGARSVGASEQQYSPPLRPHTAIKGVYQRVQINTGAEGGVFSNPVYTGESDRDEQSVFATVTINFAPADNIKAHAKKIGMIQTNRRTVMQTAGGSHDAKPQRTSSLTEEEQARAVDDRTHIDRRDYGEHNDFRQNNPVYQSAENRPATADAKEFISQSLSDIPAAPEHHGALWLDSKPNAPAVLKDRPSYPSLDRLVVDKFETVAMVLEGEYAGRYLGSVKWGWEANRNKVSMRKFELSRGTGDASPGFVRAAKAWNAQQIPKEKDSKDIIPTIKIPLPG